MLTLDIRPGWKKGTKVKEYEKKGKKISIANENRFLLLFSIACLCFLVFFVVVKIKFEREGDQAPGIIPADIVFVLNEREHPRFKREGNNLIIVLTTVRR